MKIGIDIDDTMTNTFDYLQPYISEYFKVDLKYLIDNSISYNTLTKKMKKREYEFAKEYFDLVIPNTPFKEDCSKYIGKIKKLGNEIIIITARDKRLYIDEYATTIKELENNKIVYDKLICDFDKAKVCKKEKLDLLIDDSIHNCKSAEKLGIKTILFNSKINKNIKVNLKRVDNWKDLYDIIKNLN